MFSKMSGKCQGILLFPVVSNDEKQKNNKSSFLNILDTS